MRLALLACLMLTGCGAYGPVLVGIAGSALVDINQDWITGQLPFLKISKTVAPQTVSGTTAAAQ